MRAAEAIAAFEALPLAGLTDVLGDATPLVLAPHADDESLGCGGLIAACCTAGRPPVVAIITDGAGSHPGSRRFPPERLRAMRAAEVRAATERLGLPPDQLHLLGLPDTAAPQEGLDFHAAVAVLTGLAERGGCQVVLAPWRHDPHCDHAATHRMADELARRAGMTLLSYPVWGWLLPPREVLAEPPIRGWRLDISDHLDRKRQAIAAHASQYSALIDDDPQGFRLPADLLDIFDRPYEVFCRTA